MKFVLALHLSVNNTLSVKDKTMLKKQYLKSKPICKVTFSLPKEAAEGAKEVKVLGEFNNWSWEEGTLMKASKTDYKATVELEAGRAYQFRYMIDKTIWENDYSADGYTPSPYSGTDNSVVVLDSVPVAEKKPAATAKKAAPKKAATPNKKATAKKATVKKATKKAAPKKAAKTTKDNLKKIEGIGPKIEQLLQAAGILTFDNLAKAKVTTLKKVLAEAGSRFKMHDPTTWTEQAKLAAAGKWEKLEVLQEELKGGKRK
jgi:predicted flap endonuclease-1-like 5' DNA nuclease